MRGAAKEESFFAVPFLIYMLGGFYEAVSFIGPAYWKAG